jgi:hypothetical protein
MNKTARRGLRARLSIEGIFQLAKNEMLLRQFFYDFGSVSDE